MHCTKLSVAITITSRSLKERTARLNIRDRSKDDAGAGNTHPHHCDPHRCRASCPHCALEQNRPPHCPYQMPQQLPSALAGQCPLADRTQQCMHCSQCRRLADRWCAQSRCTGLYQGPSARCAALASKWLMSAGSVMCLERLCLWDSPDHPLPVNHRQDYPAVIGLV